MRKLLVIILAVLCVLALPVTAVAAGEYSDAELCAMAKVYCIKHGRWVAKHYEVDRREGDNVVIHAFDVVEDYGDETNNSHVSTSDWFTINRKTGVGTDFAGDEVKLVLEAMNVQMEKSDSSLRNFVQKIWRAVTGVEKTDPKANMKALYAGVISGLSTEENPVRDIHELYYDLDGDSQEELMISYVYDDTSYDVFDIYTIKDGKVVPWLQTDFFLDIGGRAAEFGVAKKDDVTYVCLHEENISIDWPEKTRFGSYRLLSMKDNRFVDVLRLEYRDEYFDDGEKTVLRPEKCSTLLSGEKISYDQSRAWRDAIEWLAKVTL